MTRPIIKDHNVTTGEITEREMTLEEFNKWQIAKEKEESETQAKAAARQAILDRLGLTEEEARLLLG